MLASPVAGSRLVGGSGTIVAGAEIGATSGILVLTEILVVAMPVAHLFDFVALFAQNDEFFLAASRGRFRLVETSEGLAVVLNPPRREAFES